MRVSAAVLVLLFSVSLWSQHEESPKANAQPAPKAQPILFSHKLHVPFDTTCAYCHEMPEPGEEMTYPAESKCMACHASVKTESPAIRKLATYRQRPPACAMGTNLFTAGLCIFLAQDSH